MASMRQGEMEPCLHAFQKAEAQIDNLRQLMFYRRDLAQHPDSITAMTSTYNNLGCYYKK